ncbi:MAG: hypothetical protein AAF447_10365 [Myxococcota bacterium]
MRLSALVLALVLSTGCEEGPLPLNGDTCVYGEKHLSWSTRGIENWVVLVAPEPACRAEALAFVDEVLAARNEIVEAPYRLSWREADAPFPLDHEETLPRAQAEPGAEDLAGVISANVFCDLESPLPEAHGGPSYEALLSAGLLNAGEPRAFPGDTSLSYGPRDAEEYLLRGLWFGDAAALTEGPTPGVVYVDGDGRLLCLWEEVFRPGESEVEDCGLLPGRTRIDDDPTRCLTTMQPSPPEGPGLYPVPAYERELRRDDQQYVRAEPTGGYQFYAGTDFRVSCVTRNTCGD